MNLKSIKVVRDLLKSDVQSDFYKQNSIKTEEFDKLPAEEQVNLEWLNTLAHNLATDEKSDVIQFQNAGDNNYVLHGAALCYAETLNAKHPGWFSSTSAHKGYQALVTHLGLDKLTPQDKITLLDAYKKFLFLNDGMIKTLETNKINEKTNQQHLTSELLTKEIDSQLAKIKSSLDAKNANSGWLSRWNTLTSQPASGLANDAETLKIIPSSPGRGR